MDISSIPLARRFVCLDAVIDWHSRRVLAWRLSISMDTAFCTEAVDKAIARYGTPDIFNTDQGCQFTSAEWTGKLLGLGIKISMDGRGRWMDHVFIERLWRSVKYEEIYLFEHATVHALRAGLRKWFGRYNDWRPHETLGNLTPSMVYQTASRAVA